MDIEGLKNKVKIGFFGAKIAAGKVLESTKNVAANVGESAKSFAASAGTKAVIVKDIAVAKVSEQTTNVVGKANIVAGKAKIAGTATAAMIKNKLAPKEKEAVSKSDLPAIPKAEEAPSDEDEDPAPEILALQKAPGFFERRRLAKVKKVENNRYAIRRAFAATYLAAGAATLWAWLKKED